MGPAAHLPALGADTPHPAARQHLPNHPSDRVLARTHRTSVPHAFGPPPRSQAPQQRVPASAQQVSQTLGEAGTVTDGRDAGPGREQGGRGRGAEGRAPHWSGQQTARFLSCPGAMTRLHIS